MLYYISSKEILETLLLEKLLESIFLQYPDITSFYINEIMSESDVETKANLRNSIYLLNENIKNWEVDEDEEKAIIYQFKKILMFFKSWTQNLYLINKNRELEEQEKIENQNISIIF